MNTIHLDGEQHRQAKTRRLLIALLSFAALIALTFTAEAGAPSSLPASAIDERYERTTTPTAPRDTAGAVPASFAVRGALRKAAGGAHGRE